MRKINSSNNKKRITTILALVMLGIGTGGALWYYSTKSSNPYAPPTQSEQDAGDAQKEEILKADNQANSQKSDDNPSSTPAGKETANIIVTDATYYSDDDTVEVRAYISNAYEDGGTCTAEFAKDDLTVVQTSSAFRDARNTQCGAINIARNKFSAPGNWKLIVTYESSKSSGKTSEKTVSIK